MKEAKEKIRKLNDGTVKRKKITFRKKVENTQFIVLRIESSSIDIDS